MSEEDITDLLIENAELRREAESLRGQVDRLRRRVQSEIDAIAHVTNATRRPAATGRWGTSGEVFWLTENLVTGATEVWPAHIMMDGTLAYLNMGLGGPGPREIVDRDELSARFPQNTLPRREDHCELPYEAPRPKIEFQIGSYERLESIRMRLSLAIT